MNSMALLMTMKKMINLNSKKKEKNDEKLI